MKIFLVIALCTVAALAAPSPLQDERSPAITLREYWALNKDDLDERIINGSPAVLGQFPFQCSNLFTVGTSTFICGCSLIHPNFALTAAHCAQGASSFQIGLGSLLLTNVDANRVIRTTSDGRPHPTYNSNNLNNDIAVVGWTEPVVSTANIQVVALPTAQSVGVGATVTAIGWGRISDADPSVSQTLNFVTLTTISNPTCAAVFGTGVVIPSTLCAVGTGPSGNVGSTCHGDSGGPLGLIQGGIFVQEGVVSFVHVAGCGSGNPSGYVRTQSFIGWINQQFASL